MMTTEELYKKYGDVKVFVLPNIYAFGSIEECTPIKNFDITWIEHVGEFKPRYLMETDINYRQIIPYVIVKYQDDIFVTTRIDGDSRLIGKCSIGIGGHIDKNEKTFTTQSIIKDSLVRELEEELVIDYTLQVKSIKLVGIIQSDNTEVDKVHLGLVYVAELLDDNIAVRETDTLSGEWVPIDTLLNLKSLPWETWSRLCIDKLIGGGYCD